MEPVSNSNRPSFPASAPRRCALALPHLQVPSTVLRALSSRRAVFAVRTRYGLFSVLVRARVGGLEARARQKRSICAINVDGFKRGDVGKRRCCAHVTPGERAARWTSRIDAHRSTGWTGHPRDCGEDGEEEREAGGRVASGNHRQKSSQSLKATKKRRYYPASYVGLFWKSLDIYFPITSKVTAPRDFIYFILFYFFKCIFLRQDETPCVAAHMSRLLFLLSAPLQKSSAVLSGMLCGLLRSPVTAMPLAKGGRRELNRRQQREWCAFCRCLCANVWIRGLHRDGNRHHWLLKHQMSFHWRVCCITLTERSSLFCCRLFLHTTELWLVSPASTSVHSVMPSPSDSSSMASASGSRGWSDSRRGMSGRGAGGARLLLYLGLCHMGLGAMVLAFSFTSMAFTSSARVRQSCPFWAGFFVSEQL